MHELDADLENLRVNRLDLDAVSRFVGSLLTVFLGRRLFFLEFRLRLLQAAGERIRDMLRDEANILVDIERLIVGAIGDYLLAVGDQCGNAYL